MLGDMIDTIRATSAVWLELLFENVLLRQVPAVVPPTPAFHLSVIL